MAPQNSNQNGTLFQVVEKLNELRSGSKARDSLAARWFDTDPEIIKQLLDWCITQLPSARTPDQTPVILDPFMGTGEVLKQAHQTGLKPIGIDINPVAWFFAKTTLDRVESRQFQNAIKNLTTQPGISGQALQDELHGYYKTECPCEEPHDEKADILKIFWIQTAVCSNPMCAKRVPLFDDFIISQKKITVPYHTDARCPACHGVFDWDLKQVSMISHTSLMVNSLDGAAGVGRLTQRWVAGTKQSNCPHCQEQIEPEPSSKETATKKVLISILYCPYCQAVWQYRGPLSENVRCPGCGSAYYPKKGNIRQPDWYQCPHCGTIDKISISLKEMTSGERLPVFPYALEGFCATCAKNDADNGLIHQNQGHFFKKVSANDLSHFLASTKIWSQQQSQLDFPISKINVSRETQPLVSGNFFYWFQLFNQRQLLSLSTLFSAICQQKDEPTRNLFLSAFLKTLEYNNLLVTFNRQHNKVSGIFDSHPISIPYGYTELNVLGFHNELGSFNYFLAQLKKELKYRASHRGEKPARISLWCSSLASLVQQRFLPMVDLIFTEQPTRLDARFLNWSAFYYAWLRLALKQQYAFFSQEHVYRVENINYYPRRKNDVNLYFQRIKNSLQQAGERLNPGGWFILIFPPQPDKFWPSMIETIFQAGLVLEFICPITTQGKGKSRKVRLKKLIFGCRQLQEIRQEELPRWPDFINLIYGELERAWQQLQKSENSEISELGRRYWILGKVLAGIQPHVASVLEEKFPLSLAELFQLIYMLLDWISHPTKQLPAELITMDCISYLYLAYFSEYLEITQSELDAMCQGICEPEILIENRILRRVKRKLDINYIVIDPLERYDYLQSKYRNIWQNIGVQAELFSSVEMFRFNSREILIDMIHLLLGKLAYGEEIQTWLEQHPATHPKIRAATKYMKTQPLAHHELLEKLWNQLPQAT